MIGALFLIVLFLLLVYWYYPRKPIPGELHPATPISPQLPYLGAAFQLIYQQKRILHWFTEQSLKYGTWTFYTPHLGQVLTVRDAESVEFMLKGKFDDFPKGWRFEAALGPLLGHGIFVADGEKWYGQRKTFSRLFKSRVLKTDMFETFLKHGRYVREILRNSKRLNILELFYRYTFDSIGVIGFGVDLDTLHQKSPVSQAFDVSLETLRENMTYKPWFFMARSFFQRPELKQSLETLNGYATELIKARRQDPDVASKTDVLSIYIAHSDEDDLHLRDVIMNFLIAGRDTTGQTLQWLFYELSQHRDVEAKLLEEIRAVLGDRTEPVFEDLKQLKYLECCIKETLRLYPPVPYNAKHASEDCILPNGVAVRKGTMTFFGSWVLGRDPAVWPRADEFWPDRWLTEEVNKIHPYQYIPFHAGPRTCLGQRMAEIEMKTLCCLLLPSFKMTHPDDHKVNPLWNFTLKSEFDMDMLVEAREG